MSAHACDVFFNRDERHTRGQETPPAIADTGDRRFIAPRDTDHGGTWLIVNDAGLTLGLLNDYGSSWLPDPARPRVSRGQVLLACASATTFAEVDACLRRQELPRVSAFHILAFAPGTRPHLWHWEGAALKSSSAPSSPAACSSSSFSPAEVVAARLARLAHHARDPGRPTPAELASYHHTYDRDRGAFSVLMRRPDASTRSICHVHVGAVKVVLDYERVLWAADPGADPSFTLTVSSLSLRAREYSGPAGDLMGETTP